MIHLDTSYLVRAVALGSPWSRELLGWLGEREELRVSAVVWAEFGCGPVRPDEWAFAVQVLGPPIPFSGPQADVASHLFNLGGRRRGSLQDCMIAATAIGQGALLATADTRDFRRYASAGLTIHEA